MRAWRPTNTSNDSRSERRSKGVIKSALSVQEKTPMAQKNDNIKSSKKINARLNELYEIAKLQEDDYAAENLAEDICPMARST